MLGRKLEPGVKGKGWSWRSVFKNTQGECVMVLWICAILFVSVMFNYLETEKT